LVYVCTGAALRGVINELCGPPVGWSWPALLYIICVISQKSNFLP
jgi:hypothetical protein